MVSLHPCCDLRRLASPWRTYVRVRSPVKETFGASLLFDFPHLLFVSFQHAPHLRMIAKLKLDSCNDGQMHTYISTSVIVYGSWHPARPQHLLLATMLKEPLPPARAVPTSPLIPLLPSLIIPPPPPPPSALYAQSLREGPARFRGIYQ